MNYIEYDESLHGKLTYPEGFIDLLKGIPLEEQINFFRIGNGLYLKEEFSKRRKTNIIRANLFKQKIEYKQLLYTTI